MRISTLNKQEFEFLKRICERPSMYCASSDFRTVASYIDGVHTTSRCLIGFREWLVVKATTGNNLAWWGVIELLARNKGIDEEAEKVTFMGELFTEFYELNFKSRHNKLFMIHLQYYHWMKSQRWYKPDSPHFIEPSEIEFNG